MIPVETRGLRKSFGTTEVLHGIGLSVPEGRLTGFLGPNGAGKSTTIRILMGLLRETAGEALLFGLPARAMGPRSRARVGYLAGEVRFYPGLTGRGTLAFLSAARRMDCHGEIRRLAEMLDLNLDRRVRHYSTGMKQKLGLIQAMMHRPDLLILDEPTNGLDPLVRKVLFGELRRFVADGKTVLFSSHTLGEVDELCDEVIIVRNGQVIEQERIETLRDRALRRVEIRFQPGRPPTARLPDGFGLQSQSADRICGTWRGPVRELLQWLSAAPVEDVAIGQPSLEDLFLNYYGGGTGSKPERPGNGGGVARP